MGRRCSAATRLRAVHGFTWTTVAAGTYTLKAVAVDNTGASASSATATVTVSPPANQPPTVTLTAPTSGATFTAPASIALTANAADADGTVARVDFYNGTTLLGSDATAPYAFSWTSVAAGTYTLKAVAVDNTGASTSSATATVTVSPAANQPPTATLTAPASGATFTAPASISLTANAADADGTVARVRVLQRRDAARFGHDRAVHLYLDGSRGRQALRSVRSRMTMPAPTRPRRRPRSP